MNNRGFLKVLGLTPAMLMMAAIASQATAAETETPLTSNREIQWIWSATSHDVNAATSALASGHLARAVRLADTAAAQFSKPADRLIAIHNLCLARLAQGDIATADGHCRAALLMDTPVRVIWKRGALVTIDELSAPQDARALTTVIRANVAHAYGAAAADSFTSAVAAAAW